MLLPSLKITDGSIRETLSIPFQQTARYVKYYDKDLSKNDIKVIDKVLEYETLAKRYNPTISDPVKNEFNKYTTKKELLAYLKVWFKCFFKHPLVYIEATLNNIVVKKSCRGRGIGGELLETLIELCADLNMKSLTLEVNSLNTPAINLYEKFGFKNLGIRKKYYNNSQDAIIMTKYDI